MGLNEDYKAAITTLEEYNKMKPEYEKAYQNKEKELNIQKEYIEKIKKKEYSGKEYTENFKNHKKITEISSEVILSQVGNIIVYKDKQIKIKFRFKDEFNKMMSIIDTH